ncbi:MAG: DUF6502 family protein [Steroidobacteraceae bacterium]
MLLSKLKTRASSKRTEDSLVGLLFPISRLLVLGAVGIDELISAAKRAYLRAAIDVTVPAGRRLNASRLSVATGMTRKEVAALLNQSKSEERLAIRRSGQQRALRVLRGWLTDPRFHAIGARPAELPLSGQKRTFRQLVKLYGGDVTPNSVLRELERMGAVEVTRYGTLRVRWKRNEENLKPDYQLSELAKLFEDFVSAVTPPGSKPSFFRFKDAVVASSGEAAAFMQTFSRRAAALIEGFEQWSTSHELAKTVNRDAAGAKRIGIGLYLLHADPQAAGKLIAGSHVRSKARTRKRAR